MLEAFCPLVFWSEFESHANPSEQSQVSNLKLTRCWECGTALSAWVLLVEYIWWLEHGQGSSCHRKKPLWKHSYHFSWHHMYVMEVQHLSEPLITSYQNQMSYFGWVGGSLWSGSWKYIGLMDDLRERGWNCWSVYIIYLWTHAHKLNVWLLSHFLFSVFYFPFELFSALYFTVWASSIHVRF